VSVSEFWAIFDTEGLWRIILLSLGVSLSATALAALFGAPLGAALAACPIPGRQILVVAANAFLGLPPVVVGLALYLLLSRSGPLGPLGLLFTPGAMVLAQSVRPDDLGGWRHPDRRRQYRRLYPTAVRHGSCS
jgi:ABC-type tungstate transport system substrate-binding protein